MPSQDHFSSVAAGYAAWRPGYPPALFQAIADLAPGHALAWDCGTGSGQAAVGLAAHFATVLATDMSAAQLAHATPHPRITYRQSPESASGLADGSADVVTAAQAMHWFDVEAFYAEARRVLRPRGVLAVWCYGNPAITPAIDPILQRLISVTLGAYWPPERGHIEAGYRTLPFPFPALAVSAPAEISRRLTLQAFCGYVATWSALRACLASGAEDPMEGFRRELSERWPPGEPLEVRWPLSVVAGRRAG